MTHAFSSLLSVERVAFKLFFFSSLILVNAYVVTLVQNYSITLILQNNYGFLSQYNISLTSGFYSC